MRVVIQQVHKCLDIGDFLYSALLIYFKIKFN